MGRIEGHIRLKIKIADTTLGPGKITLLESVLHEGSISGAARACGMTYRRAWFLLDTLQKTMQTPLLVTRIGGKNKGGTSLTPLGKKLITLYREAEKQSAEITRPLLDTLEKEVSQ